MEGMLLSDVKVGAERVGAALLSFPNDIFF